MTRDRPTTVWVPIDTVLPHPDNPNRMSDDVYQKLCANIDQSGFVPPIVVRSLEMSQRFTEEFDAEKLQIIDGEHRMKYCLERGHKTVQVFIVPGLSDERAAQLLLTMNRLHGRDQPQKRRELVKGLAEEMSPEELAAYLPEDVDSIVRMITEESREAIDNATEVASGVVMRTPMTIFVTDEQSHTIREAMRTKLLEIDPDEEIVECRDGAALAAVCEHYLGDV